MKQRLLILATVSAVMFAACNGGSTDGSYTKEQADSMAAAKGDSIAAALKAQNDSTIAAEAAEKLRVEDSIRIADSLFRAGKSSGAVNTASKKTNVTKKTTTTTTTKPTAPPKPAKEEPKNAKEGRFSGEKASNADAKASRFGNEQAKEQVKEDNKKAKASRFSKEAE